jgi:periplasmic protein TonB
VRKRVSSRMRLALVTSAVLHAGLIGLFWVVARSTAEVPRMRVYAVNLVSPPPQAAGEFNPVPPAAEPHPQPEPAPEPEPVPPVPEPVPPPPKEPSPAPKATTPVPPKETPKQPAPKEAPKQPAPKQEAPRPATGARPDPASAGGAGVNVQLPGVQCPSPAYCNNIVLQLNRYFRPPADATSDEAEIFFYINRDGSVSDIRVVRSTGSFRFRAAAMEAVEQAGLSRSFGPLPSGFAMDRLPVSFFFRPSR